MRLDYVVLELGPGFPTGLARDFGHRTRYVCNYLGRQLRLAKTVATAFDRLVFEGSCSPSHEPKLEGSALVAEVKFHQVQYEALPVDGRHELYLEMLSEGIRRCGSVFEDVPVQKLNQWMDEFRVGGYANTWVYKKRRLAGTGLTAVLQCSLSTEAFELRLEVWRSKRMCYSRRVLKTLPNEYVYQHRFDDVRVVGENIVVLDEGGRVVHSVPKARFVA